MIVLLDDSTVVVVFGIGQDFFYKSKNEDIKSNC